MIHVATSYATAPPTFPHQSSLLSSSSQQQKQHRQLQRPELQQLSPPQHRMTSQSSFSDRSSSSSEMSISETDDSSSYSFLSSFLLLLRVCFFHLRITQPRYTTNNQAEAIDMANFPAQAIRLVLQSKTLTTTRMQNTLTTTITTVHRAQHRVT